MAADSWNEPEEIEWVRVPCHDAKRRIGQAIDALRQEPRRRGRPTKMNEEARWETTTGVAPRRRVAT